MRQRLSGGRFRWLNEQLYTTEGSDALRLMQQHPEYFDEYHEGVSMCVRVREGEGDGAPHVDAVDFV